MTDWPHPVPDTVTTYRVCPGCGTSALFHYVAPTKAADRSGKDDPERRCRKTCKNTKAPKP